MLEDDFEHFIYEKCRMHVEYLVVVPDSDKARREEGGDGGRWKNFVKSRKQIKVLAGNGSKVFEKTPSDWLCFTSATNRVLYFNI